MMIRVDLSGVAPFLNEQAHRDGGALNKAHDLLLGGGGKGAEFTGWLRLPETYDSDELNRIKKAASKIRADSQALVVIGIGGSYLGARGAIELLQSPGHNRPQETPAVYFAGNNMSGESLSGIIDRVQDRDFSINVVSKSGTTMEPARGIPHL